MEMKVALLSMWIVWGAFFVFSIIKGRSWMDLFVVLSVFTVLVGLLARLSVPDWIINITIVAVHVFYFSIIIRADLRRRRAIKGK
jgi:hypothetical protein